MKGLNNMYFKYPQKNMIKILELENYLETIKNKLDKLEKKVTHLPDGTLSNQELLIIHLKEIEFLIQNYVLGIYMLKQIYNKNNRKNKPQSPYRFDEHLTIYKNNKAYLEFRFYDIIAILKNLEKQLKERLIPLIGKTIIPVNLNCNNNNHNISNKINYFKQNGTTINLISLSTSIDLCKENISIFIETFLNALNNIDLPVLFENKKIKSFIEKLEKESSLASQKEIDKLNELYLKINITQLSQEELLIQYQNLVELLNYKKAPHLIIDSLHRISDSFDLFNINSCYANGASLINEFLIVKPFFDNNMLINYAIVSLCAAYDKIANELIDHDQCKKDIYFKTLFENDVKFKSKYYKINPSNDFKNIGFLIKNYRNTFLHYKVHNRIDNELQEYYLEYKFNLLFIGAKYLLNFLEDIAKIL